MSNTSEISQKTDKELAEIADCSLEFWIGEKEYNLIVINKLLKHGDLLISPRRVTHLFIGPRTALESVKGQLGPLLEYDLVDPGSVRSMEDCDESQLFVTEFISCELHSISLRTIQLRFLAHAFATTYDGWETEVVRN